MFQLLLNVILATVQNRNMEEMGEMIDIFADLLKQACEVVQASETAH